MSGNPLSASSVATLMNAVLPPGQTLKTPCEVFALAVHACMTSLEFRLVGLSEDDKLGSSTTAETKSETPRLPSAWSSGSSYSFRYSHSQSSLQFLLKASRLGNKTLFYGLAPGDDKTASFEVVTSDYIDASKLPTSESPTADIFTSLFLSKDRLQDFGQQLKTSIIQKLMPSLWKEGYEETRTGPSRSGLREPDQESSRRDVPNPHPPHPYPARDPLMVDPPRRPFPAGEFPPPGFEDEYEINRPGRGYVPGGIGPNVGERDLYPAGLGPRDPLRGSFGPGFGGGGGMHPTFDDPLFRGPGAGGGPQGYDPQAPPGARYDPVGPGGELRDPRGGPRFPGGGGLGGRPPNPFGGFGDGDFI